MAKKGHNVLVIEKSKEVGEGVLCGGGFTNKAVAAFPWLKKYVDDYDGRLISGAEWKYGNKILSLPGTDMMVLSRNLFDKFLGEKAVEYGAEIVCGEKARKTVVKNDKVKVVTDGGEYEGKLLLDASGAFGPIRGSGLYYKKEHGTSLQWEFDLPPEEIDELVGNKIQLIFTKFDMEYEGYVWIFPRKSSIHVGAGGSSDSVKKNLLENLIKKSIHDYLPKLENQSPERKRGALLPDPVMPPRTAINRVMIAGDASSAVNGQGEGNYPAMVQAAVAASVSSDELEKNDISLEKYSETMAPYHMHLVETAEKMKKMIKKKFLIRFIFNVVPKINMLRKKFTNSIRKDYFEGEKYDLLQL
jgi:flavin-dependent dehydrogenase